MSAMYADIIDVVMFEALESTHVEHDHYQYNFGITQPIGLVPMMFSSGNGSF